MCKAGAALLLVLTASTVGARGQTLDPLHPPTDPLGSVTSLKRLQAKADSLAREWRRANALADMVDSLDRTQAAAGNDTIRIGALRIIANHSPLPLREAAIRAWPVIDSLYGPDALPLAGRPLLMSAYDPDTTVPRPGLRGAIQIPWDLDVASLMSLLLASVPIARPDIGLEHWLSGSVRPAMQLERERTAVYVQLVTAPSQATRSCFSGAIASCRDALELETTPDLLLRWYPSPAERRALVAATFTPYGQTVDRTRIQACVDGDDDACVDLLHALPLDAVPKPLGRDARETLLHLALRMGGREAYHRLIGTADLHMADRLARAAGVSVDSLVARWRAEVLAARPIPLGLPPSGAWIALSWALFFAVCGLRSSRWRVS